MTYSIFDIVKILRTIEDRGQEPLLPHERVMEASLSAESSMSNIVELFFCVLINRSSLMAWTVNGIVIV